MDTGIADTLNRLDAQKMAAQLDAWDGELGYTSIAPWYRSPIADTLMGDGPATDADRAWFVGDLAARTPGVRCVYGGPALCDWENLFSHFRTEIQTRRDPQTPPAEAAETYSGCVV